MESRKTSFTCPDCGGSLEKLRSGDMLQYRCRVGHAFSADSARTAHTGREENTLWTAIVLLQEGAELALEIAATKKGEAAEKLRKEAHAKRELAERVRAVVLELPSATVSAHAGENS